MKILIRIIHFRETRCTTRGKIFIKSAKNMYDLPKSFKRKANKNQLIQTKTNRFDQCTYYAADVFATNEAITY